MEHTCASHNDPQYYLMSVPSDWNDPSLFNRIHPFQQPAQFLPSPWSSSWSLFWNFPQCQLSHSAHHTIYFNMGWHIFSDWSLSFSLIFSATQLIMWESPQCVLCLWTSKLSHPQSRSRQEAKLRILTGSQSLLGATEEHEGLSSELLWLLKSFSGAEHEQRSGFLLRNPIS